jgi:hypothetical protein
MNHCGQEKRGKKHTEILRTRVIAALYYLCNFIVTIGKHGFYSFLLILFVHLPWAMTCVQAVEIVGKTVAAVVDARH